MEELFDELNQDGEFTGRTVTRDKAHQDGTWHRAVVLFLMNSKGQVLLQKRAQTKKKWPGCWDVSSGGHVNAGELGMMSAIRELREELGISVAPQDVRFISGYRSNNKDAKTWDAHHNEFYVAFKDIDPKTIKLQEGEVDEFRWIDFSDFKKMTREKDASLTTKWEAYDALVRYVEKYGRS